MSRDDEPKYRSARKRAEEHKGGGGSTSVDIPEGMKLFKLEHEGKYKIEVLPYTVGKGNPFAEEGDRHYERTFHTHRGIGAAENTYICPAQTADKKCPICEERQKINRDPKGDEQLVKDLAPKERQLFLVYDHANPDDGIQLWDVSYHLFGKALDKSIKNLEEGDPAELFFHPKKGSTLKLLIEEKHMGKNKFFAVENIVFLERSDPDLVPELLEKAGEDLPCLDDLLIIKSYEELKGIFLQLDPDETDRAKPKDDDDEKPRRRKDDDDADDEKPKRKSSDEDDERPARKKRDEDDDDEKPKRKEADDDDEKPKRKSSDDDDERPAKKKSSDGDDDDEKPKKKRDEDDDDDEKPKRKASDDDEEKPSKSSSSKKKDDEDWS